MHDVGGHVAPEGVGDVVLEGGDRAGAVHDGLDDDADDCLLYTSDAADE